ncbi:MAG: amino acid permease [Thaumarchaeota archaeon]|nr:MAG: amino acid permease [Nitrososphaerota archaeon]
MSDPDKEPGTNSTMSHNQLVRSLGLLDILMVGVAAMIGGSIFVLTGTAIGLAGSAVIVAFIINAIITLFTAMAYAELGSAMPEAGGGYLWVREGLPRPNAFISGWMAWLAHIIAGSLYAVSFASFLIGLLDMTNISHGVVLLNMIPLEKLIAVASIAFFAYLNIKGTSETGKTGDVVTIIQLGLIFILIAAGLWVMNGQPNWQMNFSNFMPMGISGVVAAMGLTFIAFEGYEVIVQTGEEVKNPRRNIPRAIFISLGAVVVLYCLIAFVSIGAIFPAGIPSWKYIGISGELGIMKAAELLVPYGAFIVLGGGMISTLAALNATTFSSARVAFAMGRNYNMPYQMSAIHRRNKTPYVAILLSGMIMAVMAYGLPLAQIAVAAGVIFLLLFTQVNMAAITIRRIYGDKLEYGFKTPFFPMIPIIGIFLNLGLAVYLLITQPLSWAITVVWVLIGFFVYRLYTFRIEIDHYAPIVTSEGDLERKDYRILIQYAPEDPDRLLKYAIRIAKENIGEINILRVITVPKQTPLSAGTGYAETAKKSFEPLDKFLDKQNILNHYLVRISHDASEAILATVEEQKIDLLITDFETFRNSKKIQTILTCDVLAILSEGNEEFTFESVQNSRSKERFSQKNLVVLYDGGDHSDVVLKATSWLERSGQFKVNVLYINTKKDDENEKIVRITDVLKQKEYLEQVGIEFNEITLSDSDMRYSNEAADTILSSLANFQPDIVIAGATISKFSFFSDPHFINLLYELKCPIIIARHFAIPGVHMIKTLIHKLKNFIFEKIKDLTLIIKKVSKKSKT